MPFPLLLLVCSGLTAALLPIRARAQAITPTIYEQYSLELLNRARAYPEAEVQRLYNWPNWEGTPALNEGVPA